MIHRFTAYRRNLAERRTHNDQQRNADDEPQYEGVIWTDGTCTLRWLTPLKSTSVWNSVDDMIGVHGHPEYNTDIVWHDGNAPKAWTEAVEAYEKSQPLEEDAEWTVERWVEDGGKFAIGEANDRGC